MPPAARAQELSDYLLERVDMPWMQDLMVACQEVNHDDLSLSRSGGCLAREPQAVQGSVAIVGHDATIPVAEPSGSSRTEDNKPPAEATRNALQWATSVRDLGVLQSLAESLPAPVLQEQVALYEASAAIVPVQPAVAGAQRILVHPGLLKSRVQVAEAYHKFMLASGWLPGSRKPRHSASKFCTTLVWSTKVPLQERPRRLRKWYEAWRVCQGQDKPAVAGRPRKTGTSRAPVQIAMRRRGHGVLGGAGRKSTCPWLREELYEWFAALRHSVDWPALRRQLGTQSRAHPKVMARFTRALVRQKALQFVEDYCRQHLVRGLRPSVPALTSRWFRGWELEHGLSMRAPNRKYKVPKAVLAQRLEIGWLNVARVRALCLAAHGYDPHMENWDQSPFHNNETGSQNAKTLAVAGREVPLVEGHADTRERWTGNFTTFSDKDRLRAGVVPYCELMFKASGERLEAKLKAAVRSGGYGPWLTVATSEKGSYRTADVLNFLDRHLPPMTEQRQWRIIMADDFSAHLSPQVRNLCWSRGYVFVPHGGGVTPVVQTVDTDLNQHVKREYSAVESAELIRQMRAGTCVPRCDPERCIEIMAGEVMNRTSLHLAAADGYLKTGMRVPLDGSLDIEVVREAGHFWEELGMRAKINAAVAAVREEFERGALQWCAEDVRRIIRPFPAKPKVDKMLQAMRDDTHIPEDEKPYAEPDEAEASDSQDAMSKSDEDGGDDVFADSEEDEALEPAVAGGGLGVAQVELSGDQAARLAQSEQLISTFRKASDTLREVGAMSSVAGLENEIRKEKRRMRTWSREAPDVLLALARSKEEETVRQRRTQRELGVLKERTASAAKLKKQVQEATATLAKRKREVRDAEALLEMRHATKTFALQALGQGRSGGGGKKGKDKRWEVLERMAKLGGGLSAPQKNDFAWWKSAWDEAMLQVHRDSWVEVFAGWMQQVLDEHERGVGNAFSLFVHSETRRCFPGPALSVP